jgi:protein SCO1/2
VRAEDLRGRAVVVSFIFTTCHDVCPLVTAQLARVQAEAQAGGLGSRVRFLSITVDPVTDTPEVLGRYAVRFGVDTASRDFLTGAPDEVGRVVREMGAFAGNDRGRVGHTNLVLFVDAKGHVAERYTGLDLPAEQVLAKLRRLAS